jgi:hypothetical protein
MTEKSKRIEYWNFLTSEKNQPRPKGLTVHRLAAIKPLLIAQPDLWSRVIELHGAEALTAAEFYHSGEVSAVRSRSDFWDAVRGFILREDRNRIAQDASPKRRRLETDNRNNRNKQPEKKRPQRQKARHLN